MLRSWAAGGGGAIVERVGRVPGGFGAQSMVGDFVVVLADGYRVVIEVRTRPRSAWEERTASSPNLDREWPIAGPMPRCISRRDAFPAEVGRFGGVRDAGDRAVDDSDGLMTSVAP